MIQYVGEEHNKERIEAKTCAFQFDLLGVALVPSSSAYVRFQEKKQNAWGYGKKRDAKKNEASSNYQEKANDKRGVWRLPHFLRHSLWLELLSSLTLSPPIPELPTGTRAGISVAWLQPAEHCNITECDKWGEVSLSQTTFSSSANSFGNLKSDSITRAWKIKQKRKQTCSRNDLTIVVHRLVTTRLVASRRSRHSYN